MLDVYGMCNGANYYLGTVYTNQVAGRARVRMASGECFVWSKLS